VDQIKSVVMKLAVAPLMVEELLAPGNLLNFV